MTHAITTWSRRIVLALMVLLACLLGNVAPYLVVLACIVLAVTLLVSGRLPGSYREPLAMLFLVAFVSLTLSFSVTAEAPGDVVFALNFVMLLLAGPLLFAMRAGADPANTRRVAWLCFAGAVVALVIVVWAVLMGETRAAWDLLGPNRMSNTAMLFGFLALIGLFAEGGRERWLLLLGPVIGLVVTLLSESRGPLVAMALMLPVVLVFGIRLLPRRAVLPVLAGIAVLGVVVVAALLTQERFAQLPQIVADLVAGNTVGDHTTHIRLLLYRAAIEAFAQSPWLGHGWDELMTAILPFMDEEGRRYAMSLPQLHNDALDFAVASGIVGLAIYALLLATPIIAAWRSPRDSQRTVRLFAACLLVTSYIGAGLTDLMFGFEFHTALYVVLATILVGYCRDRADTEPRP